MLKISTSLLVFLLIACGGKNKSSSQDHNPLQVQGQFMALANSFDEYSLMRDNYNIFLLELTKDFSFKILQKARRRGSVILHEGHWRVSGDTILMDEVGSGTYAEERVHDELYACITLDPRTLSEFMRDEIVKAGVIDSQPVVKFCKRK
ncbi:MAG: hypothetical protein CME62_13890 [Halobacteriovoraceae bacterium]|nr:hypothetical protein [Halobacteriovoraceae bacterium]|tara:strand:- start:10848 stop:11294 length:447 start_codon:yes stop_codon:yes gene_type:complete